ncbi:MAG TPA: hypothetical protein PKZ61_13560, partial [Thermoflexales bacterium]|nr:hypothetical protein [Thermoflexales bacterium]
SRPKVIPKNTWRDHNPRASRGDCDLARYFSGSALEYSAQDQQQTNQAEHNGDQPAGQCDNRANALPQRSKLRAARFPELGLH